MQVSLVYKKVKGEWYLIIGGTIIRIPENRAKRLLQDHFTVKSKLSTEEKVIYDFKDENDL